MSGVFSTHPFLLGHCWQTSPLKARWVYGRVSSAGKGESTETGVFCPFNATIDATLASLHSQLQSGNRAAQAEIDRYLIAASRPDLSHLILHRNAVPHYDNLPDISSLVCGMLGTPSTSDESDRQIHLLLRQCTPLRRRTKRAQREVMWKPESLLAMRLLVRCAHGTLLGLYPTAVRSVAFSWRMSIFALLRTLLVQPFDALNVCISHMRYIFKICLMEHLCNTVLDYHPGLAYVLDAQSGQLTLFSQVSVG